MNPMEWKNWTCEYVPMTKEDARAHHKKMMAAVERHRFKKPLRRFGVTRLWFLFRHARWNPFRRRISIAEQINAMGPME